ncbi:MAG: tetraacyldisaccharide 4'-kinase [Candidatus Hydrogenedentota bacterium]
MKEKIIKWWYKIIDSKKGIIYLFFKILSIFYTFINSLHKNMTKKKKLNSIVISIGDITLGGTGKTPFVIELSNRLKQRYKSGILSRGYKSHRKTEPIIVYKDYSLDVKETGDEPLLIYSETGLPVGVYPDRFKAGELLIDSFDINLLILDDGFQHYALHRDIDIVLIDLHKDPSQLNIFPAGDLREPLACLSRANYIAGVRRGYEEKKYLKEWEDISNKKIYIIDYKIDGVYRSGVKVDNIKEPVYVLCGIGNPDYFLKIIQAMKISIANTWIREDHADYTDKDLQMLKEIIQKGYSIITTEKDFIKLKILEDELYTLKIKIKADELIDEIFRKIEVCN